MSRPLLIKVRATIDANRPATVLQTIRKNIASISQVNIESPNCSGQPRNAMSGIAISAGVAAPWKPTS